MKHGEAGLGAPMSPRTFAYAHQRPRASFLGCSKIADYEVLGKLGEGTFGEVHRARSKKTGAHVALKKIIMHNEKDGVRTAMNGWWAGNCSTDCFCSFPSRPYERSSY